MGPICSFLAMPLVTLTKDGAFHWRVGVQVLEASGNGPPTIKDRKLLD